MLSFQKNAIPAVVKSKIWSVINALSCSFCLTFFIRNEGRVCAGWYIESSERAFTDWRVYLVARSTFFLVIGTLGLMYNLGVLALFFGKKVVSYAD